MITITQEAVEEYAADCDSFCTIDYMNGDVLSFCNAAYLAADETYDLCKDCYENHIAQWDAVDSSWNQAKGIR